MRKLDPTIEYAYEHLKSRLNAPINLLTMNDRERHEEQRVRKYCQEFVDNVDAIKAIQFNRENEKF